MLLILLFSAVSGTVIDVRKNANQEGSPSTRHFMFLLKPAKHPFSLPCHVYFNFVVPSSCYWWRWHCFERGEQTFFLAILFLFTIL